MNRHRKKSVPYICGILFSHENELMRQKSMAESDIVLSDKTKT